METDWDERRKKKKKKPQLENSVHDYALTSTMNQTSKCTDNGTYKKSALHSSCTLSLQKLMFFCFSSSLEFLHLIPPAAVNNSVYEIRNKRYAPLSLTSSSSQYIFV